MSRGDPDGTWQYIHTTCLPAGAREGSTVLGCTRSTPATDLERYNPNYIGGDFNSGASTAAQFLKRPVISRTPWRTPVPGVYLCSSSTPPGTSTHGMCGYHAARTALQDRGIA